ncbi:recombinase family protein [Sphingomonas sp. RS2018]
MKPVRCAIYTRKSSDEGLEQAFNSLDAQREACAAYILSQASEGWTALPEIYDDGGLSGGTLERPALQRLLAEVDAGRVDIIVVYKVDRLTRSLFDFAKLVERLDAGKVSFVSVTQSFNTTTSMGRLTLNMLLSFAQFEREVTAERIRDKIAASKARGMWMGGTPPIGYAPDGRTLVIVEQEAVQVRDIFARYLRLGTVRLVADELVRDRLTTPPRVNGKGGTYGGCAWSRGQIYKLLSNPVYIGMIEHKGTRYQGLHRGIVDPDIFEQVQRKLAENLQGHRSRAYVQNASLLAGKVEDEQGHPLICDHASKGNTRYRYYATRHGAGDELRIPARELETIVTDRIAAALANPIALASDLGLPLDADTLRRVTSATAPAVVTRNRPILEALIQRVRIAHDAVQIDCTSAELAKLLNLPAPTDTATMTLASTARITRTGRVVKLVDAAGAPLVAAPDTALLRLIAKAHRWWTELRKGDLDITSLSQREGVKPSYMTRVLRLAFLSPKVIDAVLKGRQSTAATISELTLGCGVPAAWEEQERGLIA